MNNKYAQDMEAVIDRVTAERDAALGREAALRLEAGTMNETFGMQEEKIDALQQRLAAADEELSQCHSMALMIKEKEWAEHVGKGIISSRVESAFTQLHNELFEARQFLTAADERADVLEAVSVKQAALLDELGIPLDEVDDLFGETLKNAKRYEYLRSVMAVENFPAPHPAWSEPLEAESKRIDGLCDAALKPAGGTPDFRMIGTEKMPPMEYDEP